MAALFTFLLVSLLALRSLILAFAESKSWPGRLFDILNVFLFGGIALILALFAKMKAPEQIGIVIFVFLGFSILIAISLVLRLRRRQHSSNFILLLLKAVFALFVLCGALFVMMSAGFLLLTEDRPVLKLTMTGETKDEYVEWQSPRIEPRKEYLKAYEVQLRYPDGKPLETLYVYGDQVAVKAKVIRLRPILNAMGFRNMCRIEYVYNGYLTADRFNRLPHRAQEIPILHPKLLDYQETFWSAWESLYQQENTNWWVKSATLESTYFPLVKSDWTPFQGSFFLTITSGGLSGVPVP